MDIKEEHKKILIQKHELEQLGYKFSCNDTHINGIKLEIEMLKHKRKQQLYIEELNYSIILLSFIKKLMNNTSIK